MHKYTFILIFLISLFSTGDLYARNQYKFSKGTIVYRTPKRATGQSDMVGFAAEPIERVRVGFIGLGMRGPGAVRRWANIEGTQVVALCDIERAGIEKSQKYLTAAGREPAAEYYGSEEAWKELCQRDDIDLVYIANLCTFAPIKTTNGRNQTETGKARRDFRCQEHHPRRIHR